MVKILALGTDNLLLFIDVKIMYTFMCRIIFSESVVYSSSICSNFVQYLPAGFILDHIYIYIVIFNMFKSFRCDLYSYSFNIMKKCKLVYNCFVYFCYHVD